jgi:hypothetical protein
VENMDVARTLKDALSDVLEEARKAPPMPNTNTQHIVLHQGDPPKPEPKMAWMCATACIVCVLVSAFSIIIALDAKAEVRSERLSREIMNKWTAQEVTAIRSYITTGKLAPMSPPPIQPEEK